jgi:acetate kinase
VTAGDAILVLNAGSSSLKFSVFVAGGGEALDLALHGALEELSTGPRFSATDGAGQSLARQQFPAGSTLDGDAAIAFLFDWLEASGSTGRVAAVGHRVVHGGDQFWSPVRVDAGVIARLGALTPLAPLHEPYNVLPMKVIAARLPALPQVACFDTAFHRGQPPLAQAFALPPEITGRGVRRYGFHGLSYEYIASVLARYDPGAAAGRAVVLHLGNGASMCAIRAGASVATTMGMTPVDGLPMGTRSGSLDPGVLLYLMDQLGMDARALETLIYHRSGLLGVSGISSDMRALEASRDPRAREAIELFVYRIGRELGSLAAALGGLDGIVFTAGIGEHDVPLRERVCRDAAWLGIELDAEANRRGGPRISTPGSRASAWVIPTNEELMIARHTRATLG